MLTARRWLVAAAVLLLVALPLAALAAQPTSAKPGNNRVQTSAPTWNDWGERAVYQVRQEVGCTAIKTAWAPENKP